jgi:hypothetical protein
MILIRICWYLCGMFLVALVGSLFISVAPGGETIVATIMGLSLAFATAATLLALILKRKLRSNPDSVIFRSRVVKGICIAVAAILTLLFVGGFLG